jgi:hypothetical protein
MLSMTLDCGRRVTLDGFEYSPTYASLFDGLPNAEINSDIIEWAQAKETWGPRKTHLIPPAVDARDPSHPVLPPALLRAWVWCNDPINPAFMGSSLVVVWFADECHAEPIADVVLRAIRGLPWEQLAEDFNW